MRCRSLKYCCLNTFVPVWKPNFFYNIYDIYGSHNKVKVGFECHITIPHKPKPKKNYFSHPVIRQFTDITYKIIITIFLIFEASITKL